MDHGTSNIKSVLEALLKTNQPPTDHEKAIIQESMAPTNAKLKAVEAQISITMAHIQALKAQVEQAETKLRHLREEEAAMLETFTDHRRVCSPFRNLPADVLREICIAGVDGEMPKLSSRCGRTPLPYVLAQICSGMRHIALTTPIIWASMHIEAGPFLCDSLEEFERSYSILACKAHAWFRRAGGLALTVFIDEDLGSTYASVVDYDFEPSHILFNALLSYSTRWKELQIKSRCDFESPALLRIAALTAVDVPHLQSITLLLDYFRSDPGFRESKFLAIPSLKHVTIQIYDLQEFTVNWAALTSLTLRGVTNPYRGYAISAIARILQQTKCLVFCDIDVDLGRVAEHYSNEISLPFLKTLIVNESPPKMSPSFRASSILNIIIAPNLETFDIRDTFFDLSFSDFFSRSPHIRELSFTYLEQDKSFSLTMGLLRRCPSLSVLCLCPCGIRSGTHDANSFLRAFVENGDGGVICPRLQYFNFAGDIDFSVETLRLFLDGKQGGISIPDVLPWKQVIIESMNMPATGTHKQMLDLISRKKAVGLYVEVRDYKRRF